MGRDYVSDTTARISIVRVYISGYIEKCMVEAITLA